MKIGIITKRRWNWLPFWHTAHYYAIPKDAKPGQLLPLFDTIEQLADFYNLDIA